jgi:hypothetical protein
LPDPLAEESASGKFKSQNGSEPGLPDWPCYNIPKREKMYQITVNLPNGHKITIKYTKLPQNIQKGHLTALKYTNPFHCKTLENLPKLVFWYEEICHLATLQRTSSEEK